MTSLDDGNDLISSLNQHDLVCSTGYALQKMVMTSNSGLNTSYYSYRCVKAILTNCVYKTVTSQTDCGGRYSGINSLIYLKN